MCNHSSKSFCDPRHYSAIFLKIYLPGLFMPCPGPNNATKEISNNSINHNFQQKQLYYYEYSGWFSKSWQNQENQKILTEWQLCPNFPKDCWKLLPLFNSINWPSLMTFKLWFKRYIYSKMHPASYSNTHHLTDFLNYVTVKNTQKLNI